MEENYEKSFDTLFNCILNVTLNYIISSFEAVYEPCVHCRIDLGFLVVVISVHIQILLLYVCVTLLSDLIFKSNTTDQTAGIH